jgi:glycosyltransferase involved in cell wall biosynthesis
MPAVDQRFGRNTKGSGYWMIALLESLCEQGNIELGVATACPGLVDEWFEQGGIRYFVIGQPRNFAPGKHRKCDLTKSVGIAKQFHPDLIHVHGTERFYGLLGARNLVDYPVSVSIQGILNAIVKKALADLTWHEIIKSHSILEILRLRGPLPSRFRFKKLAVREMEIFKGNRYFMGRTKWDRKWVERINPTAHYFKVNEMLRQPFFHSEWKLENCRKHTIIFTNATSPLRGVSTILKAIVKIRNEYPNVQLRIAGRLSKKSGYGRFLFSKINKMGLKDFVDFLGFLGVDELVKTMCRSHVFVIASYVENSPNSLSEAQLLGMPCIASETGGIPSLVSDGRTGLLFQPGNAETLANRLKQLFSNDNLTSSLGSCAREEALTRHSKHTVFEQLSDAYNNILKISKRK